MLLNLIWSILTNTKCKKCLFQYADANEHFCSNCYNKCADCGKKIIPKKLTHIYCKPCVKHYKRDLSLCSCKGGTNFGCCRCNQPAIGCYNCEIGNQYKHNFCYDCL